MKPVGSLRMISKEFVPYGDGGLGPSDFRRISRCLIISSFSLRRLSPTSSSTSRTALSSLLGD